MKYLNSIKPNWPLFCMSEINSLEYIKVAVGLIWLKQNIRLYYPETTTQPETTTRLLNRPTLLWAFYNGGSYGA